MRQRSLVPSLLVSSLLNADKRRMTCSGKRTYSIHRSNFHVSILTISPSLYPESSSPSSNPLNSPSAAPAPYLTSVRITSKLRQTKPINKHGSLPEATHETVTFPQPYSNLGRYRHLPHLTPIRPYFRISKCRYKCQLPKSDDSSTRYTHGSWNRWERRL